MRRMVCWVIGHVKSDVAKQYEIVIVNIANPKVNYKCGCVCTRCGKFWSWKI